MILQKKLSPNNNKKAQQNNKNRLEDKTIWNNNVLAGATQQACIH